jgi:hypothetical protein
LISINFNSCEKPPKYSLTPEIEFANVRRIYKFFDLEQNMGDSVIISLKFKDGDGDLGVNKDDDYNSKYLPYADTAKDKDGKKTYELINYRVDFYRKEKGVYKLIDYNLNAQFPELVPYNNVGPIDGELHFGLKLFHQNLGFYGFTKKDTVKFDVKIIDRKLNVSNTITTDSLVIFTD